MCDPMEPRRVSRVRPTVKRVKPVKPELHLVDSPVLERAIGGDEAARTTLVRRHGPAVYRLCRRLDPDPDDAFQEIWAKAFRALPRFDPAGPAQLGTWLVRITHRHLVDRHRRRQVRGEAVDLDHVPPVPATVEQHLSEHQRRIRLDAALGRLPEDARRVVILHHLEGLPLADIAAGEGCAVGTVKSRLHRARARLLGLLTEESP